MTERRRVEDGGRECAWEGKKIKCSVRTGKERSRKNKVCRDAQQRDKQRMREAAAEIQR